ncbi:MAG: squalene cyclase [Solirubrobacterales bacterium]|nr:squalene cyclase [Solirubrobacterales bacterium]
MDSRRHALGWSLFRSTRCLVAVTATILAVGLVRAAAPAAAAVAPEKTDVMFVFDTSGSMSGELTEAKEKIVEVMETSNATLPNAEYGVAEVRDYPFEEDTPSNEKEIEESEEKPWKLDQPLTSSTAAVKGAIEPLFASGGGDDPESYGRALWETDTNPNVGWRSGARHEIVLIADNVPHDNDLDEGIPESKWVEPQPWNTDFDGAPGKWELPGKWGIPGTVWTPSTNLDFQTIAKQLGTDGKPLESVEFFGTETGYLPYWEYWAGLSGGQAFNGASGELAKELVSIITTGACSGVCSPPPPPPPDPTTTQPICNLVIATATDTCTATVADTSASAPTNPTGTVTFTSASGGVFIAGSACTLAATPLSPNTSSCSVQFEPPSGKPLEPVITASYAGDAKHSASSGTTSYGPASSLITYVSIEELGTILPGGGSASIPVKCGFGCLVGGSLSTIPSGGKGASVSLYAELASSKHHHKAKPVLIGSGTLKLATAGKGLLIVKFTHKGRKALGKVGRKGVRVTLKLSVRTLYGSTVISSTKTVKLRPAKPKHKRKK